MILKFLKINQYYTWVNSNDYHKKQQQVLQKIIERVWPRYFFPPSIHLVLNWNIWITVFWEEFNSILIAFQEVDLNLAMLVSLLNYLFATVFLFVCFLHYPILYIYTYFILSKKLCNISLLWFPWLSGRVARSTWGRVAGLKLRDHSTGGVATGIKIIQKRGWWIDCLINILFSVLHKADNGTEIWQLDTLRGYDEVHV